MENRKIDNEEKIISIQGYFDKLQKQNMLQEDGSIYEFQDMKNDIKDIKNILNEVRDFKIFEERKDNADCSNNTDENDEVVKLKSELKIVHENYEEELRRMKIKVNTDIPKATLVYIVFSSMGASFFAMNLFLTIFKDIVLMHPFTSFISLVGTVGLLITSLVSIKDWREFIKNEK